MKTFIVAVLFASSFTAAACLDADLVSQNTVSAFSQKISQNCEIVSQDQHHGLQVLCDQQNNFRISIIKDEVFALVFSQQKRNAIHQCYFTGAVTTSCEVAFSDRQCDTISLD